MKNAVYGRALSRAADIVGGKAQLRERLRVSMRELDDWIAGRTTPPTDAFLKAVDIISSSVHPPGVRGAAPRENAMIEAALEEAMHATHADMGNVQFAGPEGLRIVAQRGFEQPFLEFFAVVDHRSAAACSAAAAAGRRIVVRNVAADPIFVGTPAEPVMARASVRAVQSTPIVGATGKLVGMLSTHRAAPGDFAPAQLAAVDLVVKRIAAWLEGGAS